MWIFRAFFREGALRATCPRIRTIHRNVLEGKFQLKRRPHEQVSTLAGFPWKVLFACVDGKRWQVFPWQICLLKIWHASFLSRRLVTEKLGIFLCPHQQIKRKLVKVKTSSCGLRCSIAFLGVTLTVGPRSVLPLSDRGLVSWQVTCTRRWPSSWRPRVARTPLADWRLPSSWTAKSAAKSSSRRWWRWCTAWLWLVVGCRSSDLGLDEKILFACSL